MYPILNMLKNQSTIAEPGLVETFSYKSFRILTASLCTEQITFPVHIAIVIQPDVSVTQGPSVQMTLHCKRKKWKWLPDHPSETTRLIIYMYSPHQTIDIMLKLQLIIWTPSIILKEIQYNSKWSNTKSSRLLTQEPSKMMLEKALSLGDHISMDDKTYLKWYKNLKTWGTDSLAQ